MHVRPAPTLQMPLLRQLRETVLDMAQSDSFAALVPDRAPGAPDPATPIPVPMTAALIALLVQPPVPLVAGEPDQAEADAPDRQDQPPPDDRANDQDQPPPDDQDAAQQAPAQPLTLAQQQAALYRGQLR